MDAYPPLKKRPWTYILLDDETTYTSQCLFFAYLTAKEFRACPQKTQ